LGSVSQSNIGEMKARHIDSFWH